MPKRPIRGKAVNLLSQWSYTRSQRKYVYEKHIKNMGGKKGRSLLKTQMRYFDLWFKKASSREPYKTISQFLEKPDFRAMLKDAFRRRNRRGITTSFKEGPEVFDVVGGISSFAKRQRMRGSTASVLERALKDEKLREQLTISIAEKVIPYSSRTRYGEQTKKLVELLKAAGVKNPVIIDYGTGTGQYSKHLESLLRKAGITANIVATDRTIHPEANKKLKGSRVALVEHDLAKSSYLGRYKKADVVRLGYVLQYTLRKNVGKLIRNAMKDVEVGGLIVVGGHFGAFAIYKKINRTELEQLVAP